MKVDGVVTLDDTPEIRRAYAAGLRMACEIVEFRMTLPWWLGPFTAREAKQALVSLRQGADLICSEADAQDARPLQAPSKDGTDAA